MRLMPKAFLHDFDFLFFIEIPKGSFRDAQRIFDGK